MELKYNVTGAKRKALVGKVSTLLNATTKYLGAPTFAYEVGDYHIDKIGTLTGPKLTGSSAFKTAKSEVTDDEY